MLSGLTAAFRELQLTIKAGENKPWHDKRVRQAVNHAINRQNLIDKVYGGNGSTAATCRRATARGRSPQDELKTKYEKYDLPMAREADGGRRLAERLRRDDDDVLDAARPSRRSRR